jgi:two-component system LytT family response regulator
MSSKIRVLIVDDEPLARRGIRQLLESETDFEIAGEAANGREAISSIETYAPDLVFLDVQMPLLDGFSFVEKIGAGFLPEIVFVTAYDEHAIRAFELHALDYLVKPYREDRLREAIGRARALMGRRHLGQFRQRGGAWVASQPSYPARIRVEDKDRIRFVPTRDIHWIEAQDYCVLLHLQGERILRRGTLKQFLRTLDPALFVRVHRSAAVNVRHVRELTITVSGGLTARLTSGADVGVAKAFRAELEARLRAMP